jgi:hypothetical protein
MFTLCGRGPFDRLMMSFGLWGVLPNVMNCVEFGFDLSRGFGSAKGQFWPIAIDRSTRPNNIASTTVQQVIQWEPIPMTCRVSMHVEQNLGCPHGTNAKRCLVATVHKSQQLSTVFCAASAAGSGVVLIWLVVSWSASSSSETPMSLLLVHSDSVCAPSQNSV